MHGNNANTDREEEEEYSERLNLICQFAVKDEEKWRIISLFLNKYYYYISSMKDEKDTTTTGC